MRKALVATGVAAGIAGLLFMGAAAGMTAVGATAGTSTIPPSRFALKDIPADYLALYQGAAATVHGGPLDWTILAGVGKVETNHGRSTAPGVKSGVNSYGCCAGPMQFSVVGNPSTWDTYGQGGNVYDPVDAIPAAARYLVASGAPGDYHRALLAYNHSDAYVAEVLRWADRYRGAVTAPGAGGGYRNPFPAGQWLPGRTDQGLDMCPVGVQPVRLIGAATIGRAEAVDSGWLGGGEVTYTLVSGDHAGLSIFFAEDFRPSVHPSSRVLPAGTVIGHAYPGSHCIEQGFAAGPSTDAVASPYGVLADGSNTPGGLAMTRWMRELGAQTQEDPGEGPDSVPLR